MEITTTIAITGIRSHLAHGILPNLVADHRITRIIGIGPNRPSDLPGSKVEFQQIDIRDGRRLEEAFSGVDIVMHFAFIIDAKARPEREVMDVCINGSKNVFTAAANQNVKKVIYTSSVAAYGCPPVKPSEPLVETDELNGKKSRWFYARAKATVEEYLRIFVPAHPDITVTVIRPHIIAGCRHFADQVEPYIAPAIEKKPFTFIKPASYPHAMMQLTHEDDLFAFILKAMNEDMPGTFDIASGIIDFEDFYKGYGITMKYVPWPAIVLLLGLAGIFSRKQRYQLQWYSALRYPPSVKSEKVRTTGFVFKYPSTRDILVEAIEAKAREAGTSKP
ncbi:MAG: NAD-dependent epimerase/dehydratase family protein [Candidatus Lokiarchaeota archaeon]|nr:NAD-dependent epimerase/dehydratase family protein [Candidatus Lokiarchaeota archaeon]